MNQTDKAAHTPGPWEVDEHGVSSAEVLGIARVFQAATRESWAGSDYATASHCRANARLIAAAPELLTAALQVIAWYEAEDDHSKADFHQRMQMCRDSEAALRAAIAKATGAAA